ncbi:MAG TPA: N-terminal phage integrase SAM-like domain-containing protein [Trebonia sp.]
MRPYRSCSCRGPTVTGPDGKERPGRQLGRKCPRLKADSKHGAWYVRFEAPPSADGKRRQLRVGPYAKEGDAKKAVTAALGKIDAGTHMDDRKTTLGEYLDRWLEWKRGTLKPSTFASYREGVALYFKPGLGHIRLVDLRADDIRALYAAMRKISRGGWRSGSPPGR